MKDNFYKKLKKCQKWQEVVGKRIVKQFNITSVVDFGCGNGYYLNGAFIEGAKILGYEYSYNECKEYIPEQIKNYIRYADLSIPICLNKEYDIAMSIEVAEHIAENKADIFIKNLSSSSSQVIFSAAYVGQGGDGHVNEQPKEYWIEKFKNNGFCYDQNYTNIICSLFNAIAINFKYRKVLKKNISFF